MEKLIELLNEYEGFKEDEFESWRIDEYGHLTEGGDYMRIGTNAKIISKQYGFIKWLVENDKVDRWRIENNQDYAEYLCNLPIEEYGVEILLMLLAIADEPIDYLCNILK